MISTYIALLGEARGIANIAIFFVVYSAVATVIRPPIGSLLDQKGLSIILYPSLAIAALGMILIGSAAVSGMKETGSHFILNRHQITSPYYSDLDAISRLTKADSVFPSSSGVPCFNAGF